MTTPDPTGDALKALREREHEWLVIETCNQFRRAAARGQGARLTPDQVAWLATRTPTPEPAGVSLETLSCSCCRKPLHPAIAICPNCTATARQLDISIAMLSQGRVAEPVSLEEVALVLQEYLDAFDQGTGTVYVEPSIRNLLTRLRSPQ